MGQQFRLNPNDMSLNQFPADATPQEIDQAMSSQQPQGGGGQFMAQAMPFLNTIAQQIPKPQPKTILEQINPAVLMAMGPQSAGMIMQASQQDAQTRAAERIKEKEMLGEQLEAEKNRKLRVQLEQQRMTHDSALAQARLKNSQNMFKIEQARLEHEADLRATNRKVDLEDRAANQARDDAYRADMLGFSQKKFDLQKDQFAYQKRQAGTSQTMPWSVQEILDESGNPTKIYSRINTQTGQVETVPIGQVLPSSQRQVQPSKVTRTVQNPDGTYREETMWVDPSQYGPQNPIVSEKPSRTGGSVRQAGVSDILDAIEKAKMASGGLLGKDQMMTIIDTMKARGEAPQDFDGKQLVDAIALEEAQGTGSAQPSGIKQRILERLGLWSPPSQQAQQQQVGAPAPVAAPPPGSVVQAQPVAAPVDQQAAPANQSIQYYSPGQQRAAGTIRGLPVVGKGPRGYDVVRLPSGQEVEVEP